MSQQVDLTVRGESIQRAYSYYRAGRYIVDRRYQRKLVWSVDEKQRFIDSLSQNYPVPLILVAEKKSKSGSEFEIIDGMQRLDAIFSFIENKYSINGQYFDLDTMAETKKLSDEMQINQKEPRLDREVCVSIAGYELPFSIFEYANELSVDEVFRRINSGGRKLSRQELRAAGAIGAFAEIVRKIAANIRGDVSHSDRLDLSGMQKISITNKELDYGIDIDEIFWVKNNILEKDQVRESRDEELIADIIGYMLLGQTTPSRSEVIDDFYGFTNSDESRVPSIESAIQKRSKDLIITDFMRTFDVLNSVFIKCSQSFASLLFPDKIARAPRYFQAVFLAFYKLIIIESMKISSYDELTKKMRNSGAKITITEGGRWGAESREGAINTAKGLYTDAFEQSEHHDPALVHWITQFENLVTQSKTEQAAYDFKQGFLRIDTGAFDEDNFTKILKTCSAIANIKPRSKGYVVIGVSDNTSTTEKIQSTYSVEAYRLSSFDIVGLDHEIAKSGKTPDQFFQLIIEKCAGSPLSTAIREYIVKNMKTIVYREKTIYIFEVSGQQDPSSFGGQYYIRAGNQINKLEGERLASLFREFYKQ